jgi:hypothetical protein
MRGSGVGHVKEEEEEEVREIHEKGVEVGVVYAEGDEVGVGPVERE